MYLPKGCKTMSSALQIAIVGAGPGGLTAAIILHNQGHHVRVYESDPSVDHRGQGGTLDLHADSGQAALRRAGLLDEFRAIARHEDQETTSIDPVTGLIEPTPPHPGEDADRPEIDRGSLRTLLLGALPENYIVWNARLDHIDTAAQGRHGLIFQDGSRSEADVVLGADGAWSRVRRALSSAVPSYTGITFLEGWIENPTVAQRKLVGHGSMFSFGGPEALFAQRNGEGRICVYAAVKRPQDWLKARMAQMPAPAMVTHIYRGWAANVRDLIGGCETFIERPIFSLPEDFGWTAQSGITLIGDAAHVMPPMGVGVNLAMLDAADLAEAIGNGADWQDALRQSEITVMERARLHMREVVPGFMDWFAEPSPVFANQPERAANAIDDGQTPERT